MKIEQMTPMDTSDHFRDEEGFINPFVQDAFLMGTPLGKNILIMHENFPDEVCKYIVVVNTKTGERHRLIFE